LKGGRGETNASEAQSDRRSIGMGKGIKITMEEKGCFCFI